MSAERPKSSSSPEPKPGHLFYPYWQGLLIGGVLSWVVLPALGGDPPLPQIVMILLCCLAGMALWGVGVLVTDSNRETRRRGDFCEHHHWHMHRIGKFLIDHPEIIADDGMRRALLPTEEELLVSDLSPSYRDWLRDLREDPPKPPRRVGGGAALAIRGEMVRMTHHEVIRVRTESTSNKEVSS